MRRAWLLGAAILLGSGSAHAQTVLVWSTGNSQQQTAAIATWIQQSNPFTSVTGIDVGTQSLAQISPYDRLLFFTNSSGNGNPVANGDVLADYADLGKRLVIATFSWANQGNNTLQGRIITDQLSPFLVQGGSLYSNVSMASNDASPLFAGVLSINGYYHDNVQLSAGAIQRATWSDNEPLVAQKGNVIAVNLFPDDSYGQVSGNHRQLFINALVDNNACGNGIVQGMEQCDDMGESATCDANCTFAVCGDNTLNVTAGEACDDGNTSNDDACPSGMGGGCQPASCGDGFVYTGMEDCDDGGESTACDADCTDAVCGDATFNPTSGEECDDGNMLDNDVCVGMCALAFCGDGFLFTTIEECDDGGETATCDADCTPALCGDGAVNAAAGETCDDGNDNALDDCPDGPTGTCLAAACGDGFVQTGVEECDDGPMNSDTEPDACRTWCGPPQCGDGVVDMDEECDQGNDNGADDALCDFDCLEVTGGTNPIDDDDDGNEPVTVDSGCGCRVATGGRGSLAALALLAAALLRRRRALH
jgi:MYXO-CTERM domain-containing protein